MAFQRTATKFLVKGGRKKLGSEGGRGGKKKVSHLSVLAELA